MYHSDANRSFGKTDESRNVDGKLRHAVRNYTGTHAGGTTETSTREVGYEGKRLVIAEADAVTFVLRLPSPSRDGVDEQVSPELNC